LRFYSKNFSGTELRYENFQLLQYAAKGDLDSIKNLFETHPNIDVNSRDYDGRTALHLSTEEGHKDIVSFLLSHGAQVDTVDRFNNTPLRGALKYDHQGIANMLKEAGAKLRVKEHFTKEQLQQITRDDKIDNRIEIISHMFDILDEKNEGVIQLSKIEEYLAARGLTQPHEMVQEELKKLVGTEKHLKWKPFLELMLGPQTLLQRAFFDKLAVENWSQFCHDLTEIYEEVKYNTDGKVATYIPELGNQNPDLFGICKYHFENLHGSRLHCGWTKILNRRCQSGVSNRKLWKTNHVLHGC
jgi:hypothetical protein